MLLMYYVYIIKNFKDGRLYKGMTNDLKRRVKEHNNRKQKSTKNYVPWKLLYYEEFRNREEARKRELFFKSGEGRELLKKILA